MSLGEYMAMQNRLAELEELVRALQLRLNAVEALAPAGSFALVGRNDPLTIDTLHQIQPTAAAVRKRAR